MAILSGDRITIADLPEDPHENPFEEEADDGSSPSDSGEPFARADAPSGPGKSAIAGTRATLREYRDAAERTYIVETLRELEWNISRAAIVLGVERTNLHKKIRAYGVKRGEG